MNAVKQNDIQQIEAIFKQAEEHRNAGRTDDALREYTRVIYHAPRHWPSYFYLGLMFNESGKTELALAMFQRAKVLKPDEIAVRNYLGDSLLKLGYEEQALTEFSESLAIKAVPENVNAAYKAGKLLWESNRPADAIPFLDMALSHPLPEDQSQNAIHLSRWLRALCYLSGGEYQKAWKDYEERVHLPHVVHAVLPGLKWKGEPLAGKSILFAYEQRFGDFIQFVRFLPNLIAQGARVIVQVPRELDRQIRHDFPDVTVIGLTEPLPEYDYYQLITSVPAILELSYDDVRQQARNYLSVNATGHRKSLPLRKDTMLKVGLVWAGKPDPDRSIPLQHYIPLLARREVSFYSFQLAEGRKEMQQNAVNWLIQDVSPEITDFYTSSQLLTQMDLLITVDTAIAHQAGALGVPVWVMLRYFSDWRWQLGCQDNVWYPSMRLFRQQSKSSWSEAVAELNAAFNQWVDEKLVENKNRSGVVL